MMYLQKPRPAQTTPADAAMGSGAAAIGRTMVGPRTAQLRAQAEMLNSRARPLAQRAARSGGLPPTLKAGVEALSGLSMDAVNVHYNSPKPAQLHAHAFAQGTDIHLAPGQERHLPHEAWHVVQQAQGRVRPTMQMKGGVAVNDDTGLEREADRMGARAQSKTTQLAYNRKMQGRPYILTTQLYQKIQQKFTSTSKVIQRLSHEFYDKANITYSSTAFKHMSQESVEQHLWDSQSKIVVGNNQSISVGDGLRRGPLHGQILYNCMYNENTGRHHIHVYHAHDHGKMG